MTQSEETVARVPNWGWAIVALIAAAIVGWGLLNFFLVKDVPRQWHFGALPDTPSQSIYSSGPTPQEATPPPQISPLPEAQPKKQPGGNP